MLTWPTWILAATTAAAAGTDWIAVACGRRRLEWWAKLLTMVALVATVLSAGALGTAPGAWLVVALCLGLLGDLALLGDTEGRFLAGVAAFLVGHLAYLVAFDALGLDAAGWWWLVVPVLLVVTVATRHVVPSALRVAGARLAVPLAAYTLVIAAMTVVAFRTGEPVVALGATLFTVSDALIALDLARHDFRRERGVDGVAIMATYHLSQGLLAYGVLSSL
ncbi:MAG TPA: lysoplasmalogenase family protein [Nocardioides sp.]|uniref:lysoplasmalogenase family protein n=1 Tax=Nocardioides sp. TaxID=35761 RepID=UPI002ED9FA82